MLRKYTRIIAAGGALATAGAIAITGITAASAAPRTNPAVAGTEHFQFVITNARSSTAPVIAYGVFTGAAVDHQGNSIDRFVFRNGSFKVRHSAGKGPQSFNPKTCLMTLSQRGTYKIFGGTGAYAGISGHGIYHLSSLIIGARSKGTCSQSKLPVALQQIIKGRNRYVPSCTQEGRARLTAASAAVSPARLRSRRQAGQCIRAAGQRPRACSERRKRQ